MPMLTLSRPVENDGLLHRRAVALANVRWFRAMAWRALRDGLPKAELRASNARAAALIVLRQAKQERFASSALRCALVG